MKQVVLDYKSGRFGVTDVPSPRLAPGTLLVRVRCSLISTGTEGGKVNLARQSLLGKARNRPDQVQKVIRTLKERGFRETASIIRDRLSARQPLGYSCAGTVIEVAGDVADFQVGDRVACAAPHAEIICVPKNLCVKIPDLPLSKQEQGRFVEFEAASFATVGAIAIQAIREARVQIGEKVAVIGLGLLGQLIVQLLKAAGCEVLGCDLDQNRLSLAIESGADLVVPPDRLDAFSQRFTNGKGTDAVIITADTRSNQPIELAGKICRQRGVVVAVGRVGMRIPRELFYMKELQLKISRSYGPGRYDKKYEEEGLDYPFAYVRWTENRNMEAFLTLIAAGKINVEKLITHRFNIQEAEQAYQLILQRSEPFLGVIFNYDSESNQSDRSSETVLRLFGPSQFPPLKTESIVIGLIGCGNFARSVLIPRIKKLHQAQIKAVCTRTGINARAFGERLKCDYCTTDYRRILEDPQIQAVLITTRHDTHAQIVIDALKAGKHVFVEKPLALYEQELREIKKAWEAANVAGGCLLMVGFNRRFSPHASKVFAHFGDRAEPLIINYRVNAEPLPDDHWLLDERQGGGRIIGEMCHFIDFLQFLTGSFPVDICSQQPVGNTPQVARENCLITLRFHDGSVGTITYISCGDPALPKERIEVFAEGKAAVIHDFKRTELFLNGRQEIFKTRVQDKGHQEELSQFFLKIRQGGAAPVPFESYFATTLTSFKVLEALKNKTKHYKIEVI